MKKLLFLKILKIVIVILIPSITVSLTLFQDSSNSTQKTSSLKTIKLVDSLNQLATSKLENESKTSLKLGEDAFSISDSINYKIGAGRALYNIGTAYENIGMTDSAVLYLKKAFLKSYSKKFLLTPYKKIILSDSSKAKKTLAVMRDISFSLGKLLSNKNEFDSSLFYLRKCMAASVKIKDSNTVANTLNYMGVSAWRRGDFNNAVKLYRAAIRYRKNHGSYQQLSKWSNNLGAAYFNLGNYTLALEKYIDAVKYRKKFTDKESSIFLNNIGLIHLRLNDVKPAANYFSQALKIAQKDNSILGMGYSYLNFGEYYAMLGKYDSAQSNFKKAKYYYNILNDVNGIAKIYNRCGELQLKNNRIELAEKKFNKAYCLSNKHGLKLIKTNSLINLAEVYIKKNEFNKAIKSLKTAEMIAKNNLFEQMLLNVYKLQSNLFQKKNSYKTALLYYKKYDELRNKLNDESKLRIIADAKEKYRANQREAQNKVLRKENKLQENQLEAKQRGIMYSIATAIFTLLIIVYLIAKSREKAKQHSLIVKSKKEIENINNQLSKINRELENSNATKDKFFSIISHDLKNPFNTLLGATQILKDEYNDLDDAEKEEIFEIVYNDTKKLYSLLENLLFWANSQRGNIKPKIINLPLYESIGEIVTLYRSSAEKKDIKITIDIPKKLLIRFDEFMFNTIIRNLLSNAIKFTFKGGEIVFKSEEKGGKIHLFVKDNGMGIKKENLKKIFDSGSSLKEVGTNKEVGTGLGLILCSEFVKENNATISVSSVKGKGTTFELVLEKA